MPTVKPWNATSAIARNISVVNAPEAMGGAGVRQCTWLKPMRACSMSTGRRNSPTLQTPLLPTAVVHFMGHLGASVSRLGTCRRALRGDLCWP
eukprot:5945238-Pyramimonas_sp.AAC.1